jgi:hypothetical protein
MHGRGVARRSNSRDGADGELRHSWVDAVRYVRGGRILGLIGLKTCRCAVEIRAKYSPDGMFIFLVSLTQCSDIDMDGYSGGMNSWTSWKSPLSLCSTTHR